MVCALPFPALFFSSTPDDLHRSHDGPPPHHALRVAELGGRARADALARDAARRAHRRLAADARLGIARRRAVLTNSEISGDVWLARLAATLAHHRHAAEKCGQ